MNNKPAPKMIINRNPKVFKDSFGRFYTNDLRYYTQEKLQALYMKQNPLPLKETLPVLVEQTRR